MVITKTPLRISFFGGGSDIPSYYKNDYGLVVSSTINRYINIALNFCQTDHIRVVYSEMETVDEVDKLKHDRVREALKEFSVKGNVEICSFSDVPTKGTGLGSSSTFTVGLVNALYAAKVLKCSRYDIAELACKIEIERCSQPIGKQDQYAAAFGGFNAIRFYPDRTEVTALCVNSDTVDELNSRFICYSTGVTRQTSDVLGEQVKNLESGSAVSDTKSLVDMAEKSIKMLLNGKLDDFGDLLHHSWMKKKSLASTVSNEHIDEMYSIAKSAGALGGKILGAGGGGYMLLYVPAKNKSKVVRAMQGFKPFHFKFTDTGTTAQCL